MNSNTECMQKLRAGIYSIAIPLKDPKLLALGNSAHHGISFSLWRILSLASRPFSHVLATYMWAGRSSFTLTRWLEKLLLRLVGWLSGIAFGPRHPLSRFFFAPRGVRRWQLAVGSAAAGGIGITAWRMISDSFNDALKQRRACALTLADAESYEHWKSIAQQLSQFDDSARALAGCRTSSGEGFATADGGCHSDLFDAHLLKNKTEHLQQLLLSPCVRDTVFSLRIDLLRNVANITHSRLHEKFLTIPQVIHEYLHTVKKALAQVRDWPESDFPLEEKLSFFRETRHAFGRTALLLSGGGGLGMFHLGVCKALFERRLLPRVLAGSSAGSIVCACVGTRTDYELRELFSKIEKYDFELYSNSKATELVQHLFSKGTLHDMAHLVKKLRVLIGDLTFQEAYERTGRILNVTVCPADTNEPARLLNYLTAPHALVWSAVAASSAFPGLYPAQHLLARNSAGEVVKFSTSSGGDSLERRWRDGSLEIDLPTKALSELFNCNHFVVSQTNPHIVPLLHAKKALPNMVGDVLQAELKHRCLLLQLMLPRWLPSKWLSLFTQPWEGDITITLPAELWGVASAIMNPTETSILQFVRMGELATWEKISAIECNCTIEATLDACVQKLAKKHVRGNRSMAAMSSRIPSWLHVPHAGMVPVASWCNASDSDMATVASWGGSGRQHANGLAAAGSETNHTGSENKHHAKGGGSGGGSSSGSETKLHAWGGLSKPGTKLTKIPDEDEEPGGALPSPAVGTLPSPARDLSSPAVGDLTSPAVGALPSPAGDLSSPAVGDLFTPVGVWSIPEGRALPSPVGALSSHQLAAEASTSGAESSPYSSSTSETQDHRNGFSSSYGSMHIHHGRTRAQSASQLLKRVQSASQFMQGGLAHSSTADAHHQAAGSTSPNQRHSPVPGIGRLNEANRKVVTSEEATLSRHEPRLSNLETRLSSPLQDVSDKGHLTRHGRSMSMSHSLGLFNRGSPLAEGSWGATKKKEEEEAQLEDLIALAKVDCSDHREMGDLWSQLRPMSQGHDLLDYDAIIEEDDVFAY